VEATDSDDVRQIGLGILQHHADDDTFHRSESFQQMEALLAKEFRRCMPNRFDHRPALLGHIVVELMLDAMLAATDTTLLNRYYAVLETVDAGLVQHAVNHMVTRKTNRLAPLITGFCRERFLDDYLTDEGLFLRLNQVLKRVRLEPMTTDALDVLATARTLLHKRGRELCMTT
jgi:hypothetical protein